MDEPSKPLSRQRIYQLRKQAQGLCVQCGKRPIHPSSKRSCWYCGTKRRMEQREKLGWKPGGWAKLKRPTETKLSDAA